MSAVTGAFQRAKDLLSAMAPTSKPAAGPAVVSSPSDIVPAANEVGGQFMRELANTLNRWGLVVDTTIDNELDRLEGRRFLLRMLASSIEIYIESGSADFPHFHSVISDSRKSYADSPDTDYLRAHIELKHGAIYRLYGNVPSTTLYYGVQLYRATGGQAGKNMSDEEIPRKPNGDFELFITALKPSSLPEEYKGKPVLQGEGDEIALIVRQYFSDRTKEVPLVLNIARVDAAAPSQMRTYLDREFFAEGARRAFANLDATMSNTLRAHAGLSVAAHNAFMCGNGTNLFPTLDNRYMVIYLDDLDVKADEQDSPVIILRGKIPPARYFSVCIYNRWLESLDYIHHPVYYNNTKIAMTADGTWEMAVSNIFPGHIQWLDATGHSSVYVISRELLPESKEDPEYEVIRTTVRDMPTVSNRFFQQGIKVPARGGKAQPKL